MEFPLFKLVDSTTKEPIGFEYLTIDGWKNDVWDYGEREGVFDQRELGDGFVGIVQRNLWTGKILKNGNKVFVGDEITPGNHVEFSFGCFNINGDRELSSYSHLFS